MAAECQEEAGVSRPITRFKPVGAVSYTGFHQDRDWAVKPDTLFCFDLAVPKNWEPRPVDGEVESFEREYRGQIDGQESRTTRRKPNVGLVPPTSSCATAASRRTTANHSVNKGAANKVGATIIGPRTHDDGGGGGGSRRRRPGPSVSSSSRGDGGAALTGRGAAATRPPWWRFGPAARSRTSRPTAPPPRGAA